MEKAIKEGKKSDVIMSEFDSQIKIVMNGISVLEERLAVQQETEHIEARVDKETVKILLQEITQLLESDLTEAMNRLETLNRHLANSPIYEEFKRLEKQIENFDTDAALGTVETIAGKLELEL